MMITIIRSLVFWTVLFCQASRMSFAFVTPPPSSVVVQRSSSSRIAVMPVNNDNEKQDDDDDDDERNEKSNMMMSARSARILLPIMTAASTAALVAGHSLPAHAGIGTVVPFDVSLKENFSGSITNSVVLLRLNSSLRKQRGYYQNKAVVAVYNQKPSELSVMLAKQFSDGTFTSLDGGGLAGSGDDGKKRALILFGPDVDIARDGTVGEIRGNTNIQATETSLIEKLKGNLGGLDEVTLLGGLIIHRSKEGGKDSGEDCFQAASIATLTSGGDVIDLFGPAFGDLPTPRAT